MEETQGEAGSRGRAGHPLAPPSWASWVQPPRSRLNPIPLGFHGGLVACP